jgi:AcrR family transcriptional regulator
MTKERQIRKQEEVRAAILDAAREIISKEGVKGLSIRKITNAIEYSPAIVYHYFKDKNEIVETLIGEGYRKILNSIGNVHRNEKEPEKEIKEVFSNYIIAALDNQEEYMSVMLNDDSAVLQRTALLAKGISQRSQTMQLLCETLQRGISQGRFIDLDVELTAQIIWTSAFGLTIKLIVEKNIPEEHINSLIEHNFRLLFNGIIKNLEVE